MKRTSLLIGLVVAVLAVPAGVAIAGNEIDCSSNTRPECPGTNGDDDFEGEDVPDGNAGAQDFITGGPGSDDADGNSADDVLLAGKGADGLDEDFEGEDNGDWVDGGRGHDGQLEGDNGEDTVLGGPGDDTEVEGDDGPDTVRGGRGDDGRGSMGAEVAGGSGDNEVHGNEGSDRIFADSSGSGDRERIFGDTGNDDIFSDDGEKDIVNCGRGSNDTVAPDGIDELNGCEIVEA
jgi:serralysin